MEPFIQAPPLEKISRSITGIRLDPTTIMSSTIYRDNYSEEAAGGSLRGAKSND
jgi:hypothetical protein